MSIARRIKHAFRGQVSPRAALFEISRRGCVALRRRYERGAQSFEKAGAGRVRLSREFANLTTPKLLEHFRSRSTPSFYSGFELAREKLSEFQRKEFPAETSALLAKARGIVTNHRWPLLGYGELGFGQEIEWLRDPVSGARWPPDGHADVARANGSGADVRVLWELNRLGHLITLGRAYAVTGDEGFAEDFFIQVEGWRDQNRPGFGPNWTCAMEVALRAMNLLAAFQLLRGATNFTEERLALMLTLFEQHGRYIRRHLEFSYIATSNHYLSDVVGLLWLGVCLPELDQADEWRAFGLREMLREMDKQVLPGGAHYESSTGYHRFVLELFLYSFILCRANSIEIGDEYWQKLRSMIKYLHAYLRPDGQAPLIGDTDSGQVMPIASHTAADHGHLLGIAAVLFNEPDFKINDESPEELFWLLGETALETFRGLAAAGAGAAGSSRFSEAGTLILRDQDSYLLLNASRTGLSGRGAHGHNDALSVEVAACGTCFISDPGTYVYTADLALRHQFRSTSYHSTVEVDGREQNTIEEGTPFNIGDEARPHQLRWESNDQRDLVIAEHYGYKNLPNGQITHLRAVMFEKTERYWLIADTLLGTGRHTFRFGFHIAPGLEVLPKADGLMEICDNENNARLLIASLDLKEEPAAEPCWFSRDYGSKIPSVTLCWKHEAEAPLEVRWLLVPICAGEDTGARLALVEDLRQSTISDLRFEISDLRSEEQRQKTKDKRNPKSEIRNSKF
ncbi:MAG: alginate lyase family protein [Pyrinomonadaceae bacterium]|nr:alginate lyase family protein [Pyrinomonadaceae bacterium]